MYFKVKFCFWFYTILILMFSNKIDFKEKRLKKKKEDFL